MIEQRNSKRHKTIWKVFFPKGKKYELVGYLMDIAEGGGRFFLERTSGCSLEIGSKMKVVIKPDELERPADCITVEIRWAKEWNSNEGTCEIGVRFSDLEKHEKEYLDYLIEKFNKDEKEGK